MSPRLLMLHEKTVNASVLFLKPFDCFPGASQDTITATQIQAQKVHLSVTVHFHYLPKLTFNQQIIFTPRHVPH